jgi:hypothetical protein
MPLHREIFWVGKQWAVTGYGVQACDQKQKSKFDIEASRLWDDDLVESMQAQKWLNIEDFEKALGIAREHHPEPPRKPAATTQPDPPKVASSPTPAPKAAPAPVLANFAIQADGCRARFLRPWRVRLRWQR